VIVHVPTLRRLRDRRWGRRPATGGVAAGGVDDGAEQRRLRRAAHEALGMPLHPHDECPLFVLDALHGAVSGVARDPQTVAERGYGLVVKRVDAGLGQTQHLADAGAVLDARGVRGVRARVALTVLDRPVGDVGQMLVPAERITEVKRGKKVSSERKLYPGYIYIEMEPKEPLLETIRDVDGVTGFLGADPRAPDALSVDEAERIIKISTAQSSDEQRAAIVDGLRARGKVGEADMLAIQLADCVRITQTLSDHASDPQLHDTERLHTIQSLGNVVGASETLTRTIGRLRMDSWDDEPPRKRAKR